MLIKYLVLNPYAETINTQFEISIIDCLCYFATVFI